MLCLYTICNKIFEEEIFNACKIKLLLEKFCCLCISIIIYLLYKAQKPSLCLSISPQFFGRVDLPDGAPIDVKLT